MPTERIEPRSRAVSPAPWITDVATRRTARERIEVVDHVRPVSGRVLDPRVTVVLITFDRRAEAVETLQRLGQLPERPHVIVVVNGSGDGTAEAVRAAHPWVELVALATNAGAAARNLGVRLATTRYVAFNDDDTWWEPGSLTIAGDVLDAHPGIATLTATIVVEPAGGEDPVVHDMRVSELRDDPELPGTPLLSILAGASVVRRSAFLGVGGFEPKLLIGGEEELLSADLASAGWSLRHLPDLVVHHRASLVRDAHLRRRQGIRNTLWYQWLRRPAADALRRSVATLRAADRDIVTTMGVANAMMGIVWVLRERHVVPAEVAAGLRSLDQQQLHSKARRYVS
jgi:N-acetylglucosaminyl-diphospho-decaprenol L-rhamnosyltransferase